MEAGEAELRAMNGRELFGAYHQPQPGAVDKADIRKINGNLARRQGRGIEDTQLEGIENRVGLGISARKQ